MIEDFTPKTKIVSYPGQPDLLARWHVTRTCGCGVWVGIRADNGETATGAYPCRERHMPLIVNYNKAMAASLENPTTRPLVDVVDELLQAATV